MKKSVFTYTDDDYDLTITVKQATVLDGLERAALYAEIKDEEIIPFLSPRIAKNPGLVWWFKQLYADTVVLTVDIKSNDPKKSKVPKDLSFEELVKLPEVLLEGWHNTIISINPQLIPTPQPKPEKGETVEEAGEESEPSGETSS